MAISINSNSIVHQLQNQLTGVVGNSSVVVKFICASLCIGYLLSFSDRALAILTILPGNLLPPNFWLWTLATHVFVETHWWVVVCDVVVTILYGKLVEPLWGALEMVKFTGVITLVVATMTTLSYLFVFLVTQDTDLLFQRHIHGLAGYVAGFSVAVKQSMPDYVLVNSPFGKLRNRHIPLVLMVLAIFLHLPKVVDFAFPIMFAWGILVSWVYLRFYQKHSSGNYGDMVDGFSFASFFPISLYPMIVVPSNVVFALLVKFRLCKKPQPRKTDTVSSPTTVTVMLPGSDPQDAERRRQLALKALNERLGMAVAGEETVKNAPEETLSTVVISTANVVNSRQAQAAGNRQQTATTSGHLTSSNEALLSSEFEIISKNEI